MNKKILIKKVPTRSPPSNAISKVFQCGHIVEIRTIEKYPSNISQYRRLDKHSCVNTCTGEVIHFNHGKRRSDNRYGLSKSFANLRRIINLNFQGGHSELFLTLTYRTKMTNQEQLYQDFQVFMKRVKRRYPSLEYVAIVEPQHTGSYHLHVLLRRMDYALLYIPMEQLNELWTHGSTHIQRLDTVDNLGAYFTAHLKNVDLSEINGSNKPQQKSVEKGSRLKYYPARSKIYRCSQGIVRPKSKTMTYWEAKNMVRNLEKVYSNTKTIGKILEDGTEYELNAITYEQFNKRRG